MHRLGAILVYSTFLYSNSVKASNLKKEAVSHSISSSMVSLQSSVIKLNHDMPRVEKKLRNEFFLESCFLFVCVVLKLNYKMESSAPAGSRSHEIYRTILNAPTWFFFVKVTSFRSI